MCGRAGARLRAGGFPTGGGWLLLMPEAWKRRSSSRTASRADVGAAIVLPFGAGGGRGRRNREPQQRPLASSGCLIAAPFIGLTALGMIDGLGRPSKPDPIESSSGGVGSLGRAERDEALAPDSAGGRQIAFGPSLRDRPRAIASGARSPHGSGRADSTREALIGPVTRSPARSPRQMIRG